MAMLLRTIVRPVKQAIEFDKEVNEALADGYQIYKLDTIQAAGVKDFQFYAMLTKQERQNIAERQRIKDEVKTSQEREQEARERRKKKLAERSDEDWDALEETENG